MRNGILPGNKPVRILCAFIAAVFLTACGGRAVDTLPVVSVRACEGWADTRSDIAVIIPGYGHRTADPAYAAVGAAYRLHGIEPVYADIGWHRFSYTAFSHAAIELCHTVTNTYAGRHCHLFGFSFGAVIAREVARRIPVGDVMLCSLSPVYREDIDRQRFPFRELAGTFIGSAAMNIGDAAYLKSIDDVMAGGM